MEISFQGGLGSDQVTFGGGTQWETATINLPAGTGELRSSKYVVQASEAEHFTYTGGGGLDTADIVGTASDEQVTVSYQAVSIRTPAASASVSATWRSPWTLAAAVIRCRFLEPPTTSGQPFPV